MSQLIQRPSIVSEAGRTAGAMARTAVARSSTQGFHSGGGGVTACSFELDVQWILDIIDKISEFLRKVGQVVEEAFRIIGKVLGKLAQIVSWFCWIPGLGKMAKRAVEEACNLAGKGLNWSMNFRADILQFMKNALAPWEIRSAGRQINAQIVPAAEQFTEQLNPSNFESNKSWKGVAADKFRTNAQAQYEFAQQLSQGTAEFGSVVEEMGEEGVKSTIKFVQGFFKAGVSLIMALYKIWAVPVGTAVAVKDIIALVKAIIQMIKVWVQAMIAIIRQTMKLRSAAKKAAPNNEWPKIAR